MQKEKKKPTLLQSLVPIISIGLFLGIGYGVLKLRIEFLLLAAATLTGFIALRLGYSYKEMEQGVVHSISKGMPAMMVVIVVGMLIGTWMASGAIPMMIYYGLKIISPSYYLVTACVVCSIISIVTGTSYGTAGTVGVAFIGIASGLGIPLPQAAGAIVAGAYFGDKISPFSDTTNLAPIASGSNLFDHIKHLLWTTTPAWLIGLVLYFFLGLGYGGDIESPQMIMILDGIRNSFKFNVVLLIPPIMILYFAIAKKPTIPGMFISSFVAMLLAIFYQGMPLATAVDSMVHGYHSSTGVEMVDTLLTKGGMMNMMDVTLIALCAFAFAGIAQKAGMLDVLLYHMMKFANSTGKLILSAASSSIAVALMTGSSFLTLLIPGELFAPAFRKMNLAAKNLSRTVEDSGTVIVPLVPWSIAGVYMSGTLGVPTVEYWKWAFMCYLGV
ncbi:MAG: Na+/H+ antiporter NhaC, partial [bacterium]|nr:Na+/H+ antiporter NhaC [bacterium]